MNKPKRLSTGYNPSNNEWTLLQKYVDDLEYLIFMRKHNGGYYYFDSLQMYSLSLINKLSNLLEVNKLFKTLYSDSVDGLLSFGQDTFANQFCFDENGIILFNIETAEKEWIADSFSSWRKALNNNINYLTGMAIRQKFSDTNNILRPSDRLCPKIPFILGGEYTIENLYKLSTKKLLLVSNNIWKQTHNLPDGTSVTLKPTD